jgi:hypothetical protein
MDNPRAALAELASLLIGGLGDRLVGLYLFGSLAAGTFHEGKSDLDVFAVIAREIEEGEQFDALASLHTAFVSAHPAWAERIEVGYVSRAVLQSFAEVPAGRIAAISPGEPFHLREVGTGWLLNWYSVCTQGETLTGPPPLEVGPVVSAGHVQGGRCGPAWGVERHCSHAVGRVRTCPAGLHRGDTLPRALHARDREADLEGGCRRVGG